MTNLLRSITFLVILFNVSIVHSQSINFKRYDIDQGLIHSTIYTINQDKSGFIWFGTGAGLCRFDGIKFSKPIFSDSITDAYAYFSYVSKEGQLWVGYDDGSIYMIDNYKLKLIYKNTTSPSIVTGISELEKNIILFSTQSNGIYLIKNNVVSNLKCDLNKLIFSIQPIDNFRLLIGSTDGLWLARTDENYTLLSYDKKISDIPPTKINCIIPSRIENIYWIGTEDKGLYQLKVGSTSFGVQKISQPSILDESNVQWILEDHDQNLWICTFGNGVIKLVFDFQKNNFINYSIYNQTNGVGDNYIKYAFQDKEDNIWLGTYSNGISAIINEAFVFYQFKKEGLNNDILSVCSTPEGTWLGSRKILYYLKNESNTEIVYTPGSGLPSDAITALTHDEKYLWLGTERSGIYQLNLQTNKFTKYFLSDNSVENKINKLVITNKTLWAATNGGLFGFNLLTKQINHYTTDNNLPHNKINDVFVDSKQNVWVATKGSGLYNVSTNKHLKFDGGTEIEFTSITEDNSGNLWATSYGDGVFCFRKDSIIHLSEKDGLKSNYAYCIIADNEDNVWIGHRMAISRINTKTFKVISYGVELGILGDCNLNATAKDALGNLRFGSTDGLIQYNALSQKKQKKLPPIVNITSVKISDKDYDFSKPIILPYGKYRIRIDFVGLHYRSPKSVKYQYKLEGWENEWSELTENTFAYYPRVDDGKFKFLVRAYSAEGLSNEQPVELVIIVKPPLWKRWWFILLTIAVFIGILYSYIKYRERRQLQFQQYLQKMLDERTREVMMQKEEIELKNRDITDSITYAQRIQSSILPSIKKLQESFSGCFIFYQPRDIVSGDFYWYDKITDTKFVIVCGDSTGHGVPGALMSMIGTTLIKDICNRPDVIKPSDILLKLDEEMRSTLNQNYEDARTSDGMDLIACEIDIQTYKVTIASAMRPVILYKNGEQIYVSGSKDSIGGIEYGTTGKCFENQEYQLSRGDLIYMFSDGYPDQFGGPLGKKFKMVRLRNLLKDIHELPMEEQYYQIKNTFNLWKGQLDQVDDVLFMGIRL